MDNSSNHDSDANRHEAITFVQTLDDIPEQIAQVIMGCDSPQEIADILTRKNIVHSIKFGRSDEGSSHVWIEVDGIAYDPTGQGMKD
jgi:hypothetical protein